MYSLSSPNTVVLVLPFVTQSRASSHEHLEGASSRAWFNFMNETYHAHDSTAVALVLPFVTQKSPIYSQKSPVNTQKSPIYSQKSPINTQGTPVAVAHVCPVVTQQLLHVYCPLWLSHVRHHTNTCGACIPFGDPSRTWLSHKQAINLPHLFVCIGGVLEQQSSFWMYMKVFRVMCLRAFGESSCSRALGGSSNSNLVFGMMYEGFRNVICVHLGSLRAAA